MAFSSVQFLFVFLPLAMAVYYLLPKVLRNAVLCGFSLLFFALSTILSWSYYGGRCLGYLSGNNRVVDMLYKFIFIAVCVVGATGSGSLLWEISDTLNGLMALPNLIALLLLSGTVIEITRNYFDKNRKKG